MQMRAIDTNEIPRGPIRFVQAGNGTLAAVRTNSPLSEFMARLHNHPLTSIRYGEISGSAQMITGGAALDYTIQHALLPENAAPWQRINQQKSGCKSDTN